MSEATDSAKSQARQAKAGADRAGRQAQDSEWIDHAARFGLVVYGVVHLVVAVLAVRLALGDRSGQASGSGAMAELGQQPFGAVVLWVVVLGMALLVVWSVVDLLWGHRGEDGAELWRHRATDAGKAVVYVVLGVSAVRVVTGSSGGGGGGSEKALTGQLMALPGGQLIVGAVAVGILVVAGAHVHKGLSDDHADKLAGEGRTGEAGRAYLLLGKVGYVAKGVAIGVVGILFGVAAVQHDSSESGGLDEALTTVLTQPFGPYLLVAVGLGIGCFGLFCFARARHLSR